MIDNLQSRFDRAVERPIGLGIVCAPKIGTPIPIENAKIKR